MHVYSLRINSSSFAKVEDPRDFNGKTAKPTGAVFLKTDREVKEASGYHDPNTLSLQHSLYIYELIASMRYPFATDSKPCLPLLRPVQ
jgi:hypothetical protein